MEMLQGVWKHHLRPRAVVGYGLEIFFSQSSKLRHQITWLTVGNIFRFSDVQGGSTIKLILLNPNEKHMIKRHYNAELQTTRQTLTTSKHSTEFTYSVTVTFLAILK